MSANPTIKPIAVGSALPLLSELENAVTETSNTAAARKGAVGFVVWLGRVRSISPIATENHFWNAGEGDTANNCYDANPFPSERSKRQKSKTVSKGSNSPKDEKRASEAAVDAAASGSIQQT